MAEIGPGFYPGMSNEDYRQARGTNWSVLRKFKKSAKHARAAQLKPQPPTKEMVLGQAFHALVLEPERFAKEFVKVPEDAPRRQGKANMEWWERFDKENGGRLRISDSDWTEIHCWRTGLYDNPRAAELLNDPKAYRECAIVWDDPETGIRCKGRLDLVARWQGISVVADVKTTQDATPFSFGKDLDYFDYAGQIMFYLDGLNTIRPLGGGERVPYFLAVEKQEPFDAVVYELGQASREQARINARTYLTRYAEAQKHGAWPGLQDGVIELPAYAFKYEYE